MKKTLLILTAMTFIMCSCNQNKVKHIEQFPLSEELIGKNIGLLLEYAIFDSTKIDFVKSLICDSIRENFVLTKSEWIINDSSYFFFDYYEKEIWHSDLPGILWFDINNLDSLRNNYGRRYGINDMDRIIEKIAEFDKTSIDEVVKYRKVDNVYIPQHLLCIVFFDSFNCEDGFVEKVVLLNKTINEVMDSYSEKKFPNEKIIIRPQLKIEFGQIETLFD